LSYVQLKKALKKGTLGSGVMNDVLLPKQQMRHFWQLLSTIV